MVVDVHRVLKAVYGYAVGAVGVVEQREPHAVALHPQRVVGRAVEAVGKDAGMQDAAAPQFRDGRMHPGGTAVAAVVVGQHGHVDPRIAQGVGQRHGRAETGVSRIAIRAGERRFEVHDHQVGGMKPAAQVSEYPAVIEPVPAPRRRDLRKVLHDIAREQQPDTHRGGFGHGALHAGALGRDAARRRQHQPREDMSQARLHRAGYFPCRLGLAGNQPLATR